MYRSARLALRGVPVEHGRAILGPHVRTLAVELGRVVGHAEEDLQQLIVGDPRRVVHHQNGLGVPGRARAHLLVGRRPDLASGVPRDRGRNAVEVVEHGLDAPETAAGEDRRVGRGSHTDGRGLRGQRGRLGGAGRGGLAAEQRQRGGEQEARREGGERRAVACGHGGRSKVVDAGKRRQRAGGSQGWPMNPPTITPGSHPQLVEVLEQIGGILVDPVRSRPRQLLLAVAAGQQSDAQRPGAPRRQEVPHAVADHGRVLDRRRPAWRRPRGRGRDRAWHGEPGPG